MRTRAVVGALAAVAVSWPGCRQVDPPEREDTGPPEDSGYGVDDASSEPSPCIYNLSVGAPGDCLGYVPAAAETSSCQVIEVLQGNDPCPHPAQGEGDERRVGWHVDLGLDGSDRRQCEVLTADIDGNGSPDGIAGGQDCGAAPYGSCLSGWFFLAPSAECAAPIVLMTSSDLRGDQSELRLVCDTAVCS